jgi:hypothetical protein
MQLFNHMYCEEMAGIVCAAFGYLIILLLTLLLIVFLGYKLKKGSLKTTIISLLVLFFIVLTFRFLFPIISLWMLK